MRKTEKKEEDEAKSAGFRPRLRRAAGAHSALLTSPHFLRIWLGIAREENRAFARKMAQSSNPDNFFQTTFVPTIGSLQAFRAPSLINLSRLQGCSGRADAKRHQVSKHKWESNSVAE